MYNVTYAVMNHHLLNANGINDAYMLYNDPPPQIYLYEAHPTATNNRERSKDNNFLTEKCIP